MLRVAARSASVLCRQAVPAGRPALLAPAVTPMRVLPVASARMFADVKKPKEEDSTLEGRYATALFMASSDKLDKVANDLGGLRSMMEESPDFKLMVETPGIAPEQKIAALESVCASAGADAAVLNFLKVLVENKRLSLLPRMIDLFESFYRAEKGFVVCKVTSATELNSSQKTAVRTAMESRAEPGSKLIMSYDINAAILGGLVVKLGEAVYDQSVATKLERMQTVLLAPAA